ncbi:MAG TPA: nucleotide exchange factor GrpE, partial [Anaerolineae bacterium]
TQDTVGATPTDQTSADDKVETTQQQPPTPEVDIEALHKELEAAKAKASEYLDGWQRSRAEFANYKKRQEADFTNLRDISASMLIAKMLPILDDFDRATKTLPPTLQDLTWIAGVMLISRKLQLILEGEGVKPIEVQANDVFDPNIHEAVSHDAVEGIESGHVIEELQKGYKMNDRVVRPSLVRVAR